VTGLGSLRLVTGESTSSVTLYWRPGCPFCSRLTAAMRAEGIEYAAINIWDDPDAAAFVRSVANGNETVPTVTVGSTSLVNPPVGRILELLQG
jgi:glutaredoxin-like protein